MCDGKLRLKTMSSQTKSDEKYGESDNTEVSGRTRSRYAAKKQSGTIANDNQPGNMHGSLGNNASF